MEKKNDKSEREYTEEIIMDQEKNNPNKNKNKNK